MNTARKFTKGDRVAYDDSPNSFLGTVARTYTRDGIKMISVNTVYGNTIHVCESYKVLFKAV